jgi:hypothetical protein
MVGEASISLATACFGTGVNGNAGYDGNDVLYIAFTGADAVPGASGAKWNAQNYNDFENSIAALGDKLIQRIGTTGTTPSSTVTGTPPATTCSWEGHCAGASCSSDDDCSDDLTCVSGKCGSAGGVSPVTSTSTSKTTSTPKPTTTTPSCSWAGHCAGKLVHPSSWFCQTKMFMC